jgi:hypothetical protein
MYVIFRGERAMRRPEVLIPQVTQASGDISTTEPVAR